MTEKLPDLFFDGIVQAPVKDDYELMTNPYFALSKKPRRKPMEYRDERNGITIRIEPGPKGIATIWDKDVLTYLATQLLRQRNAGIKEPDRVIRFNVHDFLRLTARGTGKHSYELFYDAIYRLQSTTITTSVDSSAAEERAGFSWIAAFKVTTKKQVGGKEVMTGCEIALNEWQYRAIVRNTRVLTIDPAYFKITGGLERRLYELAQKHMGDGKARWEIRLPRLLMKCGSQMEPRQFKRQLRNIVKANNIPGFQIMLARNDLEDCYIDGVFQDYSKDAPPDQIKVIFYSQAAAGAAKGQQLVLLAAVENPAA